MAIMKDGFSTIIVVGAGVGGVLFKEKRVKPSGLDRGGKIDITNMRSNKRRTSWTKSLVTETDITAVVEWDPLYYNEIVALMEFDGPVPVTIEFPKGEIQDTWGSLDKFDPGEIVEGEQPTATITICVHSLDDNDIERPGVVLVP
jgi:hypothetical protein